MVFVTPIRYKCEKVDAVKHLFLSIVSVQSIPRIFIVLVGHYDPLFTFTRFVWEKDCGQDNICLFILTGPAGENNFHLF